MGTIQLEKGIQCDKKCNVIKKSYWVKAINWTCALQRRIKNRTNKGKIYRENEVVWIK
jgi:hypothetical protein